MKDTLTVKEVNNDFLPEMHFDAKRGELFFSGLSRVESITSFEEALAWIEDYKSNPAEKTLVKCDFSYLNSASSKVMMNVLASFQDIDGVRVEWHVDPKDIDMDDMGKMYEEILDMEFEIIYK